MVGHALEGQGPPQNLVKFQALFDLLPYVPAQRQIELQHIQQAVQKNLFSHYPCRMPRHNSDPRTIGLLQ